MTDADELRLGADQAREWARYEYPGSLAERIHHANADLLEAVAVVLATDPSPLTQQFLLDAALAAAGAYVNPEEDQ